MSRRRPVGLSVAAVALIALLAMGVAVAGAQTPAEEGFIKGQVVSGKKKPEAGVWVIAETNSLPTPFRKIVVTDKRGRFVIPELPHGQYQVWVRGYGLRDSPKPAARPIVQVGDPGAKRPVRITAQTATGRDAAAVYPANYWLSLFRPPDDTESLPGERSPALWTSQFKLSCQLCHQMGSPSARGMQGNKFRLDAGLKKAGSMNSPAMGLGRDALIDALADWGGRIADGEVPEAPPRPKGIERNMVITQWAWGDFYTYAHDEIATDKRNPTLYPNGKIWGVDLGNDRLLSVDPVTNETEMIPVPTLPGHETPWCEQPGFASLGCPAEGGHTTHLGAYDNPANPHNPMMDENGRVWMTTQIRSDAIDAAPEFCKADPVIAENGHHRQLGYYDTNTQEFQLIDTCYGTHHLQFANDGRLWVSGDSYVIGWFDPSLYDPARPETLQQAQGWSEVSVDSDGDGAKDTPKPGFNYGIIANPVDGTVWTARPGAGRGDILRYDPATDTHEVYSPPAPGAGPRGIDVDTDGNIWTALGGSGHLAKFDRSKCAQTWGEGTQCPEGWTLYRAPGPRIDAGKGPENETSADFQYYIWVDQFDTLGMGANTVIMNGTGSDSLTAFDRDREKFVVIRIPYPLNVFTRGLDGRIDDPDAGWKGRGLWFDNGSDPILHSEIQQGFAAQVQLRPNPLAR